MDRPGWWLLAAALWSCSAGAAVYRCDEGGRPSFTDKPCAAGQEPLALAHPNTLETSEGEQALAKAFDAETARLRTERAKAAEPRQPADASETKTSKSKKSRKTRAPASKKSPKAPKAPKAAGTPQGPRKVTLARDRRNDAQH